MGEFPPEKKLPVAGQAKDVKEQGSIIQLKLFVLCSSPAPNLQMYLGPVPHLLATLSFHERPEA